MSTTKLAFPTLRNARMKSVDDGKGGKLWVLAGAQDSIAMAIKANGCHYMTGKGPRTILVGSVVRLSDGLAVVPFEPDFDPGECDDDVKVKAAAPVVLSEDEILAQATAILAARKAGKGSETVKSAAARKASKATTSTSKTTETVPAATAPQALSDEELAAFS